MSKTIKRLGRGLDSLVSDLRGAGQQLHVAAESDAVHESGVETAVVIPGYAGGPAQLPIGLIERNPFQPRSDLDPRGLDSLTQSIRRSGILQPVIVRKRDSKFEIIAGERRWTAAKNAGMTTIPAVIRKTSDEQMLELALIENLQREDLNAIDRAKAYHLFCSRFNLKAEELAERLGEDRTTAINYMRLLDLPESVQRLVAEKKLGMGHARCLLGIGDELRRERLAESAAQNDWSVRALEEIVRREKTRSAGAQGGGTASARIPSAHVRDLQQRFEQTVKTKVVIHEGRRKGTGRIVIEYFSLDDFDRIAALLGVEQE